MVPWPLNRKGKREMVTGAIPKFLTPAEVSARWNGAVSVGTLANWRSHKTGPAYQKFGTRVRYPVDRLVIWEAANLHASNDNEGKGRD